MKQIEELKLLADASLVAKTTYETKIDSIKNSLRKLDEKIKAINFFVEHTEAAIVPIHLQGIEDKGHQKIYPISEFQSDKIIIKICMYSMSSFELLHLNINIAYTAICPNPFLKDVMVEIPLSVINEIDKVVRQHFN